MEKKPTYLAMITHRLWEDNQISKWNIAANSQTIWEIFKVITLAHVSFWNGGRSIIRAVLRRSPHLCSSIFLFPGRRGNHRRATLAAFWSVVSLFWESLQCEGRDFLLFAEWQVLGVLFRWAILALGARDSQRAHTASSLPQVTARQPFINPFGCCMANKVFFIIIIKTFYSPFQFDL